MPDALRLLVMDDQPSQMTRRFEFLQNQGIIVTSPCMVDITWENIVELVNCSDVILLDLMMYVPELGFDDTGRDAGVEILYRMKKWSLKRPVYVLTRRNITEGDYRELVDVLGVRLVKERPVTAEEILQDIRTLADER